MRRSGFPWRAGPAALLPLALFFFLSGPCPARGQAPEIDFVLVRTIAHDTSSFTQGLERHEDILYEGTGLYGRSRLRKLDAGSGKLLSEIRLGDRFFGEGVTLYKGLLYQLTWKEKLAFAYDPETLQFRKSFPIAFTGWGLTHDDERLIATDGSADLIFLDPEGLAEISRLKVTDGGRPVRHLNELEYIDGVIYANVWTTDRIARIDPHDGRVTGWIVLSDISREHSRTGTGNVLNGIAAGDGKGRLLVTGKRWPLIYEIELLPPP